MVSRGVLFCFLFLALLVCSKNTSQSRPKAKAALSCPKSALCGQRRLKLGGSSLNNKAGLTVVSLLVSTQLICNECFGSLDTKVNVGTDCGDIAPA